MSERPSNGKNDRHIEVACQYTVTEQEWNEVLEVVRTAICQHKDGRYDALNAQLVKEETR